MADHSSETTKPPRPQRPEYMTVPTPSPNGHDPASVPTAAKPAASVRSIEEVPPSVKDPSDQLMDAAGRVLTAMRARIAYHEQHAQRLRQACAAFATMARQPDAAQPALAGDPVAALLALAREHFPEGEGKS